MSRLGDTIKSSRLKIGMTEKQLGKKCGMAESVIKDIEAGTRIVSDNQAKLILKVLGVKDSLSTELDVAQEPEIKLRPRPRQYTIPLPDTKEPVATVSSQSEAEASDRWLDALSGIVKRVPIMDSEGVVIDHELTPIIAGKIEGGNPEKVLYFRMPDDSLRGYRIYAGDLLLVVPEKVPVNEAVMLVSYKGERLMRKVTKVEGGKLMLQSYDRDFESKTVDLKDTLILGRSVKLIRKL